MASFSGPSLSNRIADDVPDMQALLSSLAKLTPDSGNVDYPIGTKRVAETANGYEFQQYNGSSWVTLEQWNIDAQKLDGYSASTGTSASTIPVRNSAGKITGDITGTAEKANEAKTLSETNPIGKGGTGATSAAEARANLGVAPSNHASSGVEYGVSDANQYGHAKASTTTPKALGTASAGSETTSFARGDHVHPTTTATGSVLGMVKLSDSTTSTSAASTGIAASPAAVKAAMDKANSAATAASNAQTAANSAATAASNAQTAANSAATAASNAQTAANTANAGLVGVVRFVNGVGADAAGKVVLGKGVYLTESWTSGNSWYRKYSDGWVEQGGFAASSGTNNGTITLHVAMKDTNYWCMAYYQGTAADTGNARTNYGHCSAESNTTIRVGSFSTGRPNVWVVFGYAK